MPYVQLKAVSRNFILKQHSIASTPSVLRAVDSVDLHIGHSEIVGLVGESGCGKSTLARMVAGLLPPTSGQILLEGRSVLHKGAANPYVQMIFQDPFSSLNPRMCIGRSIGEALEIQKVPKKKRVCRVQELLKLVGLSPEHYTRYPHEFSGGQRQRIAIARALAPEAKLLICDEPVSALDVSVQAQVLNLLASLRRTLGLSMLFISHDLGVIHYLCHRVAVMYLGRIVELAPRKMLYDTPHHPYTKALFGALPVADPNTRVMHTLLEGDPPSPLAPPGGCHFHPRCPQCLPQCRTQTPAAIELGNQHMVRCHLYTG